MDVSPSNLGVDEGENYNGKQLTEHIQRTLR